MTNWMSCHRNWSGPGGSFVGSTGRVGGESGRKKIAGIELQLDIVFFDDGLCVGPDDLGLFECVTSDLELQRNTAQQIVEALCKGASVGQVFEILRPPARRTAPTRRSGPLTTQSGRAPLKKQDVIAFAIVQQHSPLGFGADQPHPYR